MRKYLFSVLVFFTTPAFTADFLDTQFGPDGLEIHLLKTSVVNQVLTVAFMIENKTGDSVKFVAMAIDNVIYTTKDKKYPVLKDANDKYLASTITYVDKRTSDKGFMFAVNPSSSKQITLKENAKKVGWVKFEAPTDDNWPIEVSFPGITPFTIENPAK